MPASSDLPSKTPKHVAIIMDGNGRWAQERSLNRFKGHIRGTEVAETMIEEAAQQGIEYLSLFAFSTENWGRPKKEIFFLFSLLNKYLNEKGQKLLDQNIRLSTLGDLTKLPKALQKQIQILKEKSASNTGLNLIFALNYGGRDEIKNAALNLIQDMDQNHLTSHKIKSGNFKTSDFEKYLETKSFPDPDLVIRTSGERRISNFMIWQMAYSELHFCEKFWPDFSKKDFHAALNDFSNRQRRFGSLKKASPMDEADADKISDFTPSFHNKMSF